MTLPGDSLQEDQMAPDEKHHFSMSEMRGIGLVIFALAALIYYYSWWLTKDALAGWLVVTFILALAYGMIQLIGNWALYLATHYRTVICPPLSNQQFTVDVFITACNESHDLVERALRAACAMPEDKKVWLLDDGHDPELARMASEMGVGYLTRSDRKGAKAGNINAALPRTSGDIIVIFDIDHAPKPDFLTRSLGCFVNPDVGFVQVMLTFANREESWVSSATADTSLDFYNPTSIGADGMRSTTLIGSNALIRRKALESIQGYKPGLAEDLATSIALHAAGWRSVYIPEPLAPGIAPPDLTSWFTQQLKWSRGVFELLLTDYPRLFGKLRAGHRVMYAVRMTYYWIGLFSSIHLLATVYALWSASATTLNSFDGYLIHLAPLVGMTLLLRQLALRRWAHPSLKEARLQWKPTTLVFGTWPIYTLSWLMAIFRVPLRFQPTPKTTSGSLNPTWMVPQVISIFLLAGGLIYSQYVTQTFHFMTFGFATAQIVAQVLLVHDWVRPARHHTALPPSSSQVGRETLNDPSDSVKSKATL